MQYIARYASPIGPLLLAANDQGLSGIWIEGQKYFAAGLGPDIREQPRHPLLLEAEGWLEDYFAGQRPALSRLPLAPQGSPFQQLIWDLLCLIPYGQTTTYGALARQAAGRLGRPHMSSQAVGGAVGHNPLSIIIPCHRVVGADGSLTGYAGGIDIKRRLLEHEGADMSGLFVPVRGTAL